MPKPIGKFHKLRIEEMDIPNSDFNSTVSFEMTTDETGAVVEAGWKASGVALINEENKKSFCAVITRFDGDPYQGGLTVYLDSQHSGRTM